MVCAIIVGADGRVLLAERPPGKHLADYLEFPGGKIEPNETPDVAIRRELREELELEVTILRDLGAYDFDYEEVTISLRAFVVSPRGAPRATLDVQRFYWLDSSALDLRTLAPADHEPWRAYISLTKGEHS